MPLIGFCGGPFTVSCYWDRQRLEQLMVASIAYLHLQIDAGVDAIQIFDSWAGTLPPQEFQAFSLKHLKPMVDAVKSRGVPVILFCRGSSDYVRELAALEPSAISFDWKREMHVLRDLTPKHIAIQGNLPPQLLLTDAAEIAAATQHLLDSMRGQSGFILNLGHGVLPGTPVEHVQCLIDTVRSRRA